MNEPLSQDERGKELNPNPELDNINQEPLNIAPDKVIQKTMDDTLEFNALPFSKIGNKVYTPGGDILANAAGNTYEVQYNAGNGVLGANAGFTYNPNQGGDFNLTLTENSTLVAHGGDINITAGSVANPDGQGRGGGINLTGGESNVSGEGGPINIIGGLSKDTNNPGGLVNIQGGPGGDFSQGGPVNILGGESGSDAGNTNPGGDVNISGGNAVAGDANGGNLVLSFGAKSGAGENGKIKLFNGSDVYVILNTESIDTSDKTFDFPNASGMFAISAGGTGGTGSAGAGKQYVELNVEGTIYKILHDGTV